MEKGGDRSMQQLSALAFLSLSVLVCVSVATVSFDRSQDTPPHLTVPPTIQADRGQGVTLPCRLHTQGRWYVISWARLHDNGSLCPLVSLPSGQMVPDWSQDIPRSLRMRVQPLITMMADRKEFHLLLTAMSCADRGRYQCRAVTASGTLSATTLLLMTQPPGRPRIIQDGPHHPWPLNQTRTVTCRARAGFPPQEFLWYFKTPRMRHFQVVEGQGQVIYHHEPGCRVTSERVLKVAVTGKMGGTVFRCALPGRVRDPGLFQDVTVRLPPDPLSSPPADSRLQDCPHPDCLTSAEKKMDSKSGATCVTRPLIGYWPGCWIVSLVFIGQYGRT